MPLSREQLIVKNMPLAKRRAGKFAASTLGQIIGGFDECVSICYVALIEAVDWWLENQGYHLSTVAWKRMTWRLVSAGRASKRPAMLPINFLDDAEAPHGKEPSPGKRLETADELEFLLRHLHKQAAQTLTDHFFHDIEYQDLAERRGVSNQAVSLEAAKAMRKLRRLQCSTNSKPKPAV